jgi:hypothetical protein
MFAAHILNHPSCAQRGHRQRAGSGGSSSYANFEEASLRAQAGSTHHYWQGATECGGAAADKTSVAGGSCGGHSLGSALLPHHQQLVPLSAPLEEVCSVRALAGSVTDVKSACGVSYGGGADEPAMTASEGA